MTTYLIDTHLLIWALLRSPRLSRRAQALIEDTSHRLLFSPISIAEIAIKHGQGRPDFPVEPNISRRTLLENDYAELPLTSAHACMLADLATIHKDPWDRLLVAQAISERITLVTSDVVLARYGGRVIVV